jgi:hypothetical protein
MLAAFALQPRGRCALFRLLLTLSGPESNSNLAQTSRVFSANCGLSPKRPATKLDGALPQHARQGPVGTAPKDSLFSFFGPA